MAHTDAERYRWIREALIAAHIHGEPEMLERVMELTPDPPATPEAFDAAIDKAIDYGNS